MSTYKIYFSDKSKSPILINPSEFNYDTTLVLFGRGAESWGSAFNNNLIHLLENFCNDYLPGYAGQVLQGQLWYNSDTKQLNVCTNSNPLQWKPLSNIPTDDVYGYVTDTILTNTLNNYIPLNGNVVKMTGCLLVNNIDDTSNPLSVANKKYVDTLVCACKFDTVNWTDSYVKSSGSTITTILTLIDNTSDDSYAASKKYTDEKKRIKSTIVDDINAPSATEIDLTGKLIESSSESVLKYVNYTGKFNIEPGTTEIVCTLPFALDANYFVVLSSIVNNEKDTVGTTDTGTVGDAYVELTNNTSFKVKCTSNTKSITVFFTVNGFKA